MKRENLKRAREIENRLGAISETRDTIDRSKNNPNGICVAIRVQNGNYRDFTPEPAIKNMLYAMIESNIQEEEADLLKELETL